MKRTNFVTGIIASMLSVVLLSGCASSGGITAYEKDHSRAWNLTHSVGMTQLDDSEVPKDQIPSTLWNATEMAIDVGFFMNSATLSMDLGNALGLGLIGFLTEPKGQGERSTVIAWIPEDEAESRETANLWLGDKLRDATLKAMENLGIDGEVEFHNKEKDLFLADLYYETSIKGFKSDGSECGAYFRTYPHLVSELQPIPDFIKPNSQGHQLYAGEDVSYPRVSVYCFSDTSLDPYVEFIGEISKHLPQTVFFYSSQATYHDSKLPPMVLDQGKANLFIIEES